jgi:NAD(P)H-flavin reductase
MARAVEPESRALERDPMTPLPFAVRQVQRETHDVVSLLIEPVSGSAHAGFAPGQFNMLYAFGMGEAAISISADPARPDRLWHTIRQAGYVTRALTGLKRGSTLGVRGPFGTGWPMAEAHGRDLVILCGGIGLAPLRPVIYEVLRDRARFERVSILYGARTPDDLLFRHELEAWRGRFDLHVGVSVDRAPVEWHGEVGVVTGLLSRAPFDPARAVAFICGPEIMMRFAARDLEDDGLSPERIYLSMERNMRCGIGLCGHCQYGPTFVCKDGPVFRYDRIQRLLVTREV